MRFSIFILLAAMFLTSCGKEKKAETKEILKPVRYSKIRTSDGAERHSFSGVAKAKNETKLSFKVAGTVSTIKVKLGDKVRKGQLIATIDVADYSIQTEQAKAQKLGSQANMKSAEANMKSAESQLMNAKSSFNRVERLYENNSVPLSEYEKAKGGLSSAESQYNAAKAQYQAAKTQVTTASKQVQSASNQVSYTRLISPVSGIVSAVNVEANELVNSGTAIVVISSEGQPEIEVGVPEVFIAKIKKGQDVKLHFSIAADEVFDGTVQQVAYTAGSSPTYPVIVSIKNPTKNIRPGMAANVDFIFGEEKKIENSPLVVPVAAVGEDSKGNFVFVLKKKGKGGSYIIEKRTIIIGELLPNGFEIKSGLKANEMVATAGLKSLLNGMKVKLLVE